MTRWLLDCPRSTMRMRRRDQQMIAADAERGDSLCDPLPHLTGHRAEIDLHHHELHALRVADVEGAGVEPRLDALARQEQALAVEIGVDTLGALDEIAGGRRPGGVLLTGELPAV